MLKYMYLIQSKFKVDGKDKTSGGYVGGNDPQDARARHLNQLTNVHGPIQDFVVTDLTVAGDFDKVLSSIMNERD